MVIAESLASSVVAPAAPPRASLRAVWNALANVADPEIPVVSVLELGIVRAVEWMASDPSTLVVRVTPTYSGCPATDVIIGDIGQALAAAGLARIQIEIQLSPPWTTAWITAEGRRKLREYGIAPPSGDRAMARAATPIDVTGISPLRRSAVVVACPRCGSAATRLVSQFGSTACKAHYRCADCLEPFDYFKPH